jgi:hypothetical protein
MKFLLTVDDELASAILARHGQQDAENPVEAMRGLVEYTLSAEARNATKAAAMKSAEEQIVAGLDAALEGKFVVANEAG